MDRPDGKDDGEPTEVPPDERNAVANEIDEESEGSALRFPPLNEEKVQHDTSPPARFSLLSGKNGQYFLLLLLLGLIVRLVPAYLFYGSNDVGAWRLAIRDFGQGINPYTTGKLNWPPLWPTLLLYTGRMESVYNLPDYLSVKVIPILADVSIGLAIYFWLLDQWQDAGRAFRRSLWYILNPVAIATCAMHGQFDALPVLFTVLAVMASTRAREQFSLAAAFWLSLGILAKTWPIIFVPLFSRQIRAPLGRALFVLIAVAPAALSVAILYREAPEPISRFVLSYRGGGEPYGLTMLRVFMDRHAGLLLVERVRILLYAVWIGSYIILWRRGTLMQGVCLLLLDFFVFSSAVAIQYFVWMLGPAILGDFKRSRFYTLAAGTLLAITYTFSPFDGERFAFLARVRPREFYQNNLSPHHQLVSLLIGLPVWIFCVWWWAALWRDVLTVQPPDAPLPVPLTPPGPLETEAAGDAAPIAC